MMHRTMSLELTDYSPTDLRCSGDEVICLTYSDAQDIKLLVSHIAICNSVSKSPSLHAKLNLLLISQAVYETLIL